MPSLETRPYLCCSGEAIILGEWNFANDDEVVSMPSHILDWDPLRILTFRRSLTIDVSRVRGECGLSPGAEVALTVSWRSPGSGQKGLSQVQILRQQEGRIPLEAEAQIPGVNLAGSLRLITRVILMKRGTQDKPLSAQRNGSILWEDEMQTLLEGIGSRFPMEVVDFTSIGFPKGAAWRLYWNRENLDAQAMGCFCLLLNKSHEKIVSAVTHYPPSPESQAIWSAINLGVAREIIIGALSDERFVNADAKYEAGSAGDIAQSLMNRAFPNESAQAVLERLQNSRDRFECELQEAFRLFRQTGTK